MTKHPKSERRQPPLPSNRYAFTVLSNLTVFTITFFVLNTGSSSNANETDNNCTLTTISPTPTSNPILSSGMVRADECSSVDTIGPEDANKFRVRRSAGCCFGACFPLEIVFNFFFFVFLCRDVTVCFRVGY